MPCARLLLVITALSSLPTSVLADQAGRSKRPWDQTPRDEDLRIELVTFGPGDEIHQYWGHDALVVSDPKRGFGAVYNFGMFGFGSDMLTKYLQGRLEFWVEAMPVERTYAHYRAMNRSVTLRELNLAPERRRYLAERLAWYALPENRHYIYDHYTNNCTTKLRDLIDEAIDGQFREALSSPGRMTHRDNTWRYTEHDPIVRFLLVLWMNDSMERPLIRWEEAFLPLELEALVDETRYHDASGRQVPLVERAYTYYEAQRPKVPRDANRPWAGLLLLGLAVGLVAAALGRATLSGRRAARIAFGLYEAAVGFLFGVPGLVLGLFVLTEWEVTHWNENLFLTNPLTFAAFPLGLLFAFGARLGERTMARCWYLLSASSLLLVLLKVLPSFDQDNILPMALYLPLNVGFAVAHRFRDALLSPSRTRGRLQAARAAAAR